MKNQNKVILFFTFIFYFLISIISQAQLNISLKTGYAIPSIYNTVEGIHNRTIDERNNSIIETYKAENMSFGNGIDISLSAGYIFNENIGFDCGFLYLKSKKINAFEQRIFNNGMLTISDTYRSNMFYFIPAFIIQKNILPVILFMKIGCVIGTGNVHLDRLHEDNRMNSQEIIRTKYDFSGNIAYGFLTSFGVNYFFSEKIALICNVNIINLSYIPNKSFGTKQISYPFTGYKNSIFLS